MLREHLAAWATLGFGVLLALLAASGQPAPLASALLVLLAAGAVGVGLRVEGRAHPGRPRAP